MTLWVLAGGLVGAALSLLLGNGSGSANAGLLFAFAAVPMLLVPLGARMASRDRERGFAAVLGTTPLTGAERLVGQLGALVALFAAYVALALPGAWWVVMNVSADPIARLAPFVGWGVLVGLCSIAVGLALGVLAGRRSVAGLSVGFATSITWLLLAILYAPVHGAIASDGLQTLWTLAAHASPLTWAFTAHGFHYDLDLTARTTPPGVVVALVAVTALALAALVATRLQLAEGYRSPLPARRAGVATLALVAVVGLGPVGALGLDIAPEDPTSRLSVFHAPFDEVRAADGLSVYVEVGPVEDPPRFGSQVREAVPVGTGEPTMLFLTVSGEDGRTVTVGEVALLAPAVRYEVVRGFPSMLALTGGIANATALVLLEPVDLAGLGAHRHGVSIAVVLDGTRFVVEPPTGLLAPPGLGHPGTLAAALAPPLVPAALALALPRRWNRW